MMLPPTSMTARSNLCQLARTSATSMLQQRRLPAQLAPAAQVHLQHNRTLDVSQQQLLIINTPQRQTRCSQAVQSTKAAAAAGMCSSSSSSSSCVMRQQPSCWPPQLLPPPVTRAAGRTVKCYSTQSPVPPPSQPPQHISWLQEVQVLLPMSPGLHSSREGNAHDSSSSNFSGATSITNSREGASSSSQLDSTSTSTSDLHNHKFRQLTEADVTPASSSSSSTQEQQPFDAIMVLAGGLTRDGGLPEWVHRRLDVARDLHMLQGRRPAIVCLGGGTPHKPDVLGPTGHVIHESTSCANYLMATGVEPHMIYKEVSSYDTVGNAYFSLTIHALPAGWRRIAVVTSAFHMPRTRSLFAGVYRLAGKSLAADADRYSLTFLSASDEGVFDDHVYNARLDKEAGSLAHWQRVAAGLQNLAAFHDWLYSDHLCYAVPRQKEFGKRTIQDQRLLESY